MVNPTIVVSAFNRPESLHSLLVSLNQADYSNCDNINLVISIDFSGQNETIEIAENFEWSFGEKVIIKHKKNLGLKAHILSCGDLTDSYEAIIVLEDDLLVSPSFFKYAKSALSFYSGSELVSGISLYNHQHNETSELPFNSIDDGYDAYFMKVPSSWGQLWTKEQWLAFRLWYNEGQKITNEDYLPDNVIAWPESSWKKYFCKYLIEKNKYYVYPKASYTTNTGAVGVHHNEVTHTHQSLISLKNDNFIFPAFDDCVNIYDQFFEIILNQNIAIKEFGFEDLEIDIFGTKPLKKIKSKYILSSKVCSAPLVSLNMKYLPANINLFLGFQRSDKSNAHLNIATKKAFEDEINHEFIHFFANQTDKKIKDYLEKNFLKEIVKTDVYRIGHKLVRILKKLPFQIGSKFLNRFNKKSN